MNGLTGIHVAAGAAALLAGTVAIVVCKGGRWHVRAGLGFVVAMSVPGLSAAVLGPFADPVQSPVGGLMVCCFAATGWLAGRTSAPSRPGRFMRTDMKSGPSREPHGTWVDLKDVLSR